MFNVMKNTTELVARFPNTVDFALDWAEGAVKRLGAEPGTYSVIDGNSKTLIASFSTRTITGEFQKQVWGGSRQDEAINLETETFDATDAVLLMPLEKIHELFDHQESTDAIGEKHVQWNGPFEVAIVQSICEFFGVEDLQQITQQALDQVVAFKQPQKPKAVSTILRIKVTATVYGKADFNDFLAELDYNVTSNTSGVVVTDTEIVDAI